jgi:hypothetical protein
MRKLRFVINDKIVIIDCADFNNIRDFITGTSFKNIELCVLASDDSNIIKPVSLKYLLEKELDVTLPYFGRMFNPSYDTSKNSYRFTSKDFTLSKILNKKGNLVYTISPKDVDHVRVIYIEVYKNGSAYVSIDSNDRQPISYNGYLMKNEISKK